MRRGGAPGAPTAVLLAALLLPVLAACDGGGGGGGDDGVDGGDDGGDGTDFVEISELEGDVITEEVARRLFGALNREPTPRHRYDPDSIIALVPDLEVAHEWLEHPKGELVFSTNNMGFRRDEPTQIEKTRPRVLVTGDSHTEGFVWNEETFCHQLELRLAEAARASGAPAPEVINAGVGASNPYNHIGVLRKALRDGLDPDLFVAVFFTGNDFGGVIPVTDFFTKRPRTPYTEEYISRLRESMDSIGMKRLRWGRTMIGNGYNQPYRFKHFPEEIAVAEEAVLDAYGEMQALCDEAGIPMLVALLPSKVHVDGDDDRGMHLKLLEDLGLTQDDYDVSLAMGRRVLAELERRGVRCVDMTDRLAAYKHPLYWRKDYHLNIAGNAAVARILEKPVAELLAR